MILVLYNIVVNSSLLILSCFFCFCALAWHSTGDIQNVARANLKTFIICLVFFQI